MHTPAYRGNTLPPSCGTLILAGMLTCIFARGPAVGDSSFLMWLNVTVAEASKAADQHEALKRVIRELRAGLEARYDLAAVQVWTPGAGLERCPHVLISGSSPSSTSCCGLHCDGIPFSTSKCR